MHDQDKIQEILLKIGRINDQVERLVSDAESEKEVRKRLLKDHEDRLRELEQWQAKWGGALIALGIIATIASIVSLFLKFKN